MVIVNPVGEFMINDDWSYVKALETLISKGEIAQTGWGPDCAPGGPSLVVHLLWGGLFTRFGGFSCTVLRISVLAAGIIGSLVFFHLLKKSRPDSVTALMGTLALMLNPLFLSQCFTFMTDVTFTSLIICSLYFLYIGLEKQRFLFIVFGLLFALLSILIRQLGLIIPAALLLCRMFHPVGKSPALRRVPLAVILTVIVPWLAYEYFLYSMGGTPLLRHQVFQGLFLRPRNSDLLHYILSVFSNFFLVGMMYTGFFCSPVVALLTPKTVEWKFFKYLIIAATIILSVAMALFWLGIFEFPVVIWKNVILDLGIGPIVLKDTYLHGIKRLSVMPKPLYYMVIYWGVLSAIACSWLIYSGLRDMTGPLLSSTKKAGLRKTGARVEPDATDSTFTDFFSKMCLSAGLLYLGIISVAGLHDRYLVPICAIFIIWLTTDGRMKPRAAMSSDGKTARSDSCSLSMRGGVTEDSIFCNRYMRIVLAILPIIVYGGFAVAGTRDFMEFKRTLLRAQDYMVNELQVKPCEFDGGFEYNGYHCYKRGFKASKGMSWWWVDKEDYIITLGSLPNCKMVKQFPFERIMGQNGTIEILKPE